MATHELNSLRDMLDALGAGEITTEEAAAFAREYVWPPVTLRTPDPNPFVEMQRDPPVLMRGSWAEVDAAAFQHRITSEQRTALMEAYLERERSERPQR